MKASDEVVLKERILRQVRFMYMHETIPPIPMLFFPHPYFDGLFAAARILGGIISDPLGVEGIR